MADKLDSNRRSENMRRIRSKDMAPEIVVRRAVYGLGFRFRLHRRDLPGSPDIVLHRHRKVILVHGCFWHQHSSCREGRLPKTRLSYWSPKLLGNMRRDKRNRRKLQRLGWRTLVVWECQLSDPAKLKSRLRRFLHGQKHETN